MHDHTILKFEEFFAYIRNTNSRNHIRKNCKKQWINLRNRVGNSLRCNVTSSAPFGPEVQKFYNTEEENQNNTIVYFNCSAHRNSSDRSSDFRSQGFQFDIPFTRTALSVEICDFQQSLSVPPNDPTKPRPLPSTPFTMFYSLSFNQKKLQTKPKVTSENTI